MTYIATKQYDSAISVLNKAIFYKPDWSHYYNNRGYAYAYLDQREQAILDYNIAIKLDSTDPSFYANRADSKYFLSQFESAIKDYTKAIELSELIDGYNNGIYFNNRAYARRKIGDFDGYKKDKERAKSLGYPNNYKQFNNTESCFYKINK